MWQGQKEKTEPEQGQEGMPRGRENDGAMGVEARKWKLKGREARMGPTLPQPKGKANAGFLVEQRPEEKAHQSQAPPRLHSISPKLCLGKGPGQLLEP